MYKAIATPKNKTLKNANPNTIIKSSYFTRNTEYKKSKSHNIDSTIESFAALFCILILSSQNGLLFFKDLYMAVDFTEKAKRYQAIDEIIASGRKLKWNQIISELGEVYNIKTSRTSLATSS